MRKLFCLPLGKLNIIIKKSSEFIFRVPLINNQAGRVNFGFASKMIFLLWCVCGGLLLHMLESNFLAILLKPTYEKPINTVEEVLDRGFKLIMRTGYEAHVDRTIRTGSYEMKKLFSENLVWAKVLSYFFIKS